MSIFKKTKETTYTNDELWTVKSIMARRQWVQDAFLRPGKSSKDCAEAIEKCADTLRMIEQFEKRNPELNEMFSFEKELIEGYKKMFYLKMTEMETSAE